MTLNERMQGIECLNRQRQGRRTLKEIESSADCSATDSGWGNGCEFSGCEFSGCEFSGLVSG